MFSLIHSHLFDPVRLRRLRPSVALTASLSLSFYNPCSIKSVTYFVPPLVCNSVPPLWPQGKRPLCSLLALQPCSREGFLLLFRLSQKATCRYLKCTGDGTVWQRSITARQKWGIKSNKLFSLISTLKSLCVAFLLAGKKKKKILAHSGYYLGKAAEGGQCTIARLRKTWGNGNTIQLFFVVVLLHLGPCVCCLPCSLMQLCETKDNVVKYNEITPCQSPIANDFSVAPLGSLFISLSIHCTVSFWRSSVVTLALLTMGTAIPEDCRDMGLSVAAESVSVVRWPSMSLSCSTCDGDAGSKPWFHQKLQSAAQRFSTSSL